MNKRMHRHRAGQSGVMLLEALIAILVFALGVLALVGLQTVSIRQSGDAKSRADAVMLANELIGRMWVTDRTFATLSANFATGGPEFNAWLPRVQNALLGATGANAPTVTTLTAGVPADPSTLVNVTINWKAPNEPAADPPHTITVVAQIK